MKKEMLINCLQPEEIRIAIIENGVLEELYVERASAESYVGNIYKGRVVNIEPSIQAAFVDFGVGRNGFLHVSDVEPAYYRELEERQGRRGDRDRGRGRGRDRRHHDDYDAPPRREPLPPRESSRFEEEISESPARATPSSFIEPPVDADYPEGPDIIVEEVVDEVEETLPPPEPMEMFSEPEEEPIPAEPKGEARELDEELEADADEGEAAEAPEEPEIPSAETTDEPDTEKPKRRGGRRSRGRSGGRGRKRKSEPAGEESSEAPSEEPKPRPMDSSERRTGEDDPPLAPISPRPADDLTDDDLTFSRPPSDTPRAPAQGAPSLGFREEVEEIEEEDREDDIVTEDIAAEPMEPAIPKIEPTESLEDLVEEEKALEDDAQGAPPAGFEDDEDEFGDVGEYMPRSRGRSGGRGRDRDDRRGRGGRGRDDRRPRGGRDAGRSGGGRPGFGRPKPNIEDIFKRGQEVLVQVIKEGIGTKGPTLSTYISIAGRYLVLMPGLNRIGVSRKIEDEETRRRLREIMNELRPPRGIGFIIRTAGQDRNRQELQSDLAYLSRLWQVVVKRIKKQKSPCEIYRESDMVTRTIRDIFTDDIDTIWVDEPGAYEAAKEFMEAVMPRYADRIKFYEGAEPMFHRYGIEKEIARIQERKISLPHGGSIVIDQTEALVAIDVNSGNFRADNNNAEETAYQMNLLAAKEIARQLRLRDLGGVIANDFIDMRDEKHRRGVEKALRDAVRRDRARTKILRISQFGIIEMTRQRIRPSLKRSTFQDCTHCKGLGHVKTSESVSIEVMRMMQLAANREQISRIDVRVHEEVAKYLLNKKRKEIVGLEDRGNKTVSILSAGPAVSPEFLDFMCYDTNGNEVKFTLAEEPPPRPPQRRGRR